MSKDNLVKASKWLNEAGVLVNILQDAYNRSWEIVEEDWDRVKYCIDKSKELINDKENS